MIYEKKCDMFTSGANCFLHQVNCQGVMGSGVAKQVKEKFPVAYDEYKKLCDKYPPIALLGHAQLVPVYYDNKPIWIGNLFGQLTYGYNQFLYTNYEALRMCFKDIEAELPQECTIALPYKIGCDRGGGNWKTVYNLIKEIFINHDVYICKYNGG